MKFTQVLSARRRFWAWPLPFLLTAGGGLRPAVAAERISRPYAAHVPWTLLWQAEEPVEIPVGETVQAVTLTPPPLPILPHRRGTEGISTGPILGLRFRARLHTERPAGWNNYLGLKVNGLPLGTFTSQRRPRLLNRRGYFVAQWHGETKHSFWVDRAGLPCLQVFFGPNWDTLEERLLSEREEGYWYLLEVSDVFRTEGPNTLELVNTAIASYWQGNPPPGLRLVVDALALGAIPQEAVEELRGQQLQRRRKLPGEQLTNERCTVTVVGGGGVQVESAGETYFVESAFSEPGEEGLRWNKLLCQPTVSEEPHPLSIPRRARGRKGTPRVLFFDQRGRERPGACGCACGIGGK